MSLVIPQNCDSCNKSNVCKYKEELTNKKEEIMNNLKGLDLPLKVEISCCEYYSRVPSLTRK